MADVKTFEEFVTTRSPAFLRLAYALTRDHMSAEDLLQATLARTWPAWKRISGDPEPYVRRVLVNTHSSWWRRRWHGEHPAEVLPEMSVAAPQSAVDERDALWRALLRLPKRQRAVLVLRYFGDLSEVQIAETLGMAPGTVKSYTAKGLAQLRGDPSLLEVPEPAAGVERLTAVRERIAQRRRTRVITVAAAVVVILALLLSGSTALLRNRTLEPLGPGGFPRYEGGKQTVAGGQFSFAQVRAGVSVTWIPGSLSPTFRAVCVYNGGKGNPIADNLLVAVEVNGTRLFATSCDGFGSVGKRVDDLLQVGTPVEVKILFSRGEPSSEGTLRFGIFEPVPFEQYPLPKPPNELKPLDRTSLFAAAREPYLLLEANGAWTATLKEDFDYEICGMSQTPGLLHLRLGGVRVPELTRGWWDYAAGDKCVTYKTKSAVDLSVEPEHTTGDWVLVIGSAY